MRKFIQNLGMILRHEARRYEYLFVCLVAFFLGYLCAACKSARFTERTDHYNMNAQFDIFDTTYIFPSVFQSAWAGPGAPALHVDTSARVGGGLEAAPPPALAIVRHTAGRAAAAAADTAKEVKVTERGQLATGSTHRIYNMIVIIFLSCIIVLIAFRARKFKQ